MHRPLSSITSLIALLLLVVVQSGCSGEADISGTYDLDKAAVKAAMEAEMKAKGEDKDPMAAFAMGMIESMNVSMTLNADGTASMQMSMMGEAQTASGTWTRSGKSITVTMAEPGETPTPANGTIDGDTITLKPPEGQDMPFDMVFKKKKA